MKILISVDHCHIVFTNQWPYSANFLPFNLSESQAIPTQNFTAKRCTPWGNHKIKLINSNFDVMVNK